MSHRMYLYNLSTVAEQNHDDLMMMEWKYEFPLFFHPLFMNTPEIQAPVYNGVEGGLYADTESGIEALKRFYEFIDAHKDKLITNVEAYEIAKEKVFNFLDNKANKKYFHLDAWDVFNMSDESHHEQAKDLLEEISLSNSIIQQAIEANNPAILNLTPMFNDKFSAFKEFRDLLNYEVYDYGWGVIESGYFPDETDDLIQFEENGLWGLKDTEGTIILPPQYTEMFGFDDNSGWAVVNNNNKFGYINRLGTEVIECKFDDAYDFDVNYAQVGINGKRGLINKQGEIVVECIYEDSHYLVPIGKYWAMKLNGLWGIIDNKGVVKLDFQYEKLDDGDNYGTDFYTALAPGAEKTIYLSKDFFSIGTYLSEEVEAITYNEATFYIVSEKTEKSKLFGVKDSKGNELLPVKYTKITFDYLLACFIVRDGKKAGFYKADEGFLLDCDYDKITTVTHYNSTRANGGYAIVKKGKMYGLYYTGKNPDWRIPCEYELISWLNNNFFSFKQDNLWGVIRSDNKLMLPAEFESMSNRMGYLESAIGIGFKDNKAFIIENDGEVRLLTEAEAESEIRYLDIASNYYTAAEIEILTNNSSALRQSEDIFTKAWDANDAGDFDTAIELYSKAAEMGNKDAMNNLGYLYEFEEVYKDEALAVQWYKKGADACSADAMNNLAECYKKGTGIDIDYTKAKYWYNLAINNGSTQALKNLAYYYYYDVNNEYDAEKTLDLWLRVYTAGDKEAVTPLGYTYEQKGDFNNAFRYYLEDANNGYGYATKRVGEFYALGLGCKENVHKAIDYYNKALSLDDSESHLLLARLYFAHPEVKNEVKARQHLKEALAADVEGAKELAAENKKGFFGKLFQ
ncbi:Beta-lactamase HcpA precursor [compost metagenome]